MANTSDPTFDASRHNIISMDNVFQQDPKTITQLANEFRARGWAIVRLPSNPDSFKGFSRSFGASKIDYDAFISSSDTIKALSTFFAQADAEKAKTMGYSAVAHKESVHLETPLPYSRDSVLPPLLSTAIQPWITLYDEVTVDLIEILCKPIFGCTESTLAHRADLPIAFGRHKGMLDIAYYKNTQVATLSPDVGLSTKDVNCVPHYDPGFLSISFLSTHDGLQLQDPETKTWFAGPVNTKAGQEDLGVIWLGDAAVKASKGSLRAGIHRVVYPQVAQPRIAAWYEMCTVDQLNQDRLDSIKNGQLQLPNLPGSLPLQMSGDVRLIERYYGVPMSKVMQRSDNFSAAYSDDYRAKGKPMW